MNPKVSVVIPIYNVEQYIIRCLHSLFLQSLNEIEYIFINDNSTDNSIKLLNNIVLQYPERKKYIKIINHKKNLGIAAARETGIRNATGDYIIHCDPDDYLELNMYELLYNKAIKSQADIIMCGFFIESEKKITKLKFNYNGPSKNYLENGILNQFIYASLFNKLIKREIITENSIYPFENCNYGEDLGCILRILYYSKNIVSIPSFLYHYCKRSDSITGKAFTTEELNSLIRLANNINNFFQGKGYDEICNCFKFHIKIKGRHLFEGNEKEWIALFKECRKDIFKFTDNSLKSRAFWWLAMQNKSFYNLLKRFL